MSCTFWVRNSVADILDFGAGGGGATGDVTLTDADAVAVPPGPVAVSVYVVLLPGKTCRLPLAFTVPMPGSMRIDVASPVTFHRSVAAWPRSIVDGSASNVPTTGRTGLGVSTLASGVGVGGGAGGGTFFLHPAANTLRKIASVTTPILCL